MIKGERSFVDDTLNLKITSAYFTKLLQDIQKRCSATFESNVQ